MERITTATFIYNQLDPLGSRKTATIEPGKTLELIVQENFLPMMAPGFEAVACINGIVIEDVDMRRVVEEGDHVVVTARPQGGGGGKSILGMVAMLAVVIVAAYAAPVLVSGALSMLPAETAIGLAGSVATMTSVATAGLIGLGGFIVSSLFQSKAPDAGNLDTFGDSPTYGWTPSANTAQEGSVLPILYGKFWTTPPLIARYIETQNDKQFLNLLHAVTGHYIDSILAVRINDQPSEYYDNIVIDTRLGEVSQAIIQTFGDTRSNTSVGVKLNASDWIQREVPGEGIEGFGVTLNFPRGLYFLDDKGKVKDVTVRVYIEYKSTEDADWTRYTRYNTRPIVTTYERWSAGYYSGNTWVELEQGSTNKWDHLVGDEYMPASNVWTNQGEDRPIYHWRWVTYEKVTPIGAVAYDYLEITNNSTDPFRRTFFRDRLPAGDYLLRMKLVSQPPTGLKYGSDVYWESTDTIVYDDFTYPGVSLCAVRALATDQLSNTQPRVQVLVERKYVWVFDADQGGYVQKSASNPAWACYDLLHVGAEGHPDATCTYGGSVPHTRLDYVAFKAWAEWCDLKGYYIGYYMDSTASMKQHLSNIGQVGRGMVVQLGSRFTCIVDKPVDLPVSSFLFGMGNISAGSFTQQLLSLQDRANVIEVVYFDENDNNSRQVVQVTQKGYDTWKKEDNKTQVTLPCCTSRQVALEWARASLLRNWYLTQSVAIKVGKDAVDCIPGDVIDVAHDVPQWGYSGRVVSAEANSVTLDRDVVLQPGVKYVIDVVHADATRETRNVVGVTQETTTAVLTLVEAWETVPESLSNYAFGQVGRHKKMFRVVSINRSSDVTHTINALEYAPEVYNDSVMDIPEDAVEDVQTTRNVRANEVWVLGKDGTGYSIIDVSWTGFAFSWNVFIQKNGETRWTLLGTARSSKYRVEIPLNLGTTYRVGVSTGAAPNNADTAVVTIQGKLAPPSDVTSFVVNSLGDMFVMQWNHIPDGDLWGYTVRRGESWEKGLVCVDGEQKNSATWRPPVSGTYNFWIKAQDMSGNESVNAVNYIASISLTEELNVVLEKDAVPIEALSGTLENLVLTSNGLEWIPGMSDTSDPTLLDTSVGVSTYDGNTEAGIYTSQVYDLGASVTFGFRIDAQYSSFIYAVTDLTYPLRTDQDYPQDTDTSITSLSTYIPRYRVSEDNVTWSDWVLWTGVVEVVGRYVQLQAETDLDSPSVSFVFEQITAIADVPDKEVRKNNVAISNTGTTVTLASLGLVILDSYNVGVTVLGAAAIYATVQQNADDFTIHLFNNAGTAVAGTVNYIVRGF